MKYSDLIAKTQSELSEMAYNLKKSMYTLHMQKKLNQLTSTAQIRQNRRNFARLLMKLAEIKKK